MRNIPFWLIDEILIKDSVLLAASIVIVKFPVFLKDVVGPQPRL